MRKLKRRLERFGRPLFPALVVNLFLCYDKWMIASESVDELTGIRPQRARRKFAVIVVSVVVFWFFYAGGHEYVEEKKSND